jgi:hypothetical protein
VQPHGAPAAQQPPMPVMQPAPYAQPQGHPQQPTYAAAPQQVMPHHVVPQHVQYAPQPQYAAPVQPVQQPLQHHANLPSPPPMPLLVPFAQQPPAPVPVQPQYQPVAATQQLPVVQHQPVHVAPQQPVLQPAHVVQHAMPPVEQAPAPQAEGTRRHSRAPKGMGSSLRLDDPTLRDTIARAREERAGLADEYRKLTAPLVDVVEHPQHVQHGAPEPQFVGHDANGVALFATPGVPGVHPIEQYPAPAQIAAMPRPNISASAPVDPALQTSAFQRRAPYAPQVPETANPHVLQPAVQAAPAHA